MGKQREGEVEITRWQICFDQRTIELLKLKLKDTHSAKKEINN
jgi:hypothetical protein